MGSMQQPEVRKDAKVYFITILTGSDAPMITEQVSILHVDVWGTLKNKSLVDVHWCYDNCFEIPRWNTILKL